MVYTTNHLKATTPPENVKRQRRNKKTAPDPVKVKRRFLYQGILGCYIHSIQRFQDICCQFFLFTVFNFNS